MSGLTSILNKADDNLDAGLDRLRELVAIPSISTDPAYSKDCRKAAEWLSTMLGDLGFTASVRNTTGHPMVVAHHDGPGNGAPHVLFYGHYDVQPVDPLDLWTSDPFTMQIENRSADRKVLTGRGTSDDKGQLMTFVEACRAFRDTGGGPPCRITILFEGEEECSSPSLKPFLEAHADELKADLAMVCDTTMWDAETPAISVSLRGLTSEEVIIRAASRDLHSGYYGGAAANPIHVLSKIIGDMHDADGRVTIANFYDGVIETPADIKAGWDGLGRTADRFLGEVGLSEPAGEKGRSLLEQIWARPTAEANGISGGYSGEGFKTVIPAQASAKVSFRLVGNQDPHAVRAEFRKFVSARVPSDCSVDFIEHGTSGAIQLDYASPELAKARAALNEEWGKPAAIIGMGGSIPIVGDFQSKLGMESLLVGFALDDDCVHSPNEKYDLRSFHKGVRSWIRILDALSS